ncbi:MAG TPA: GNAT family N-acetyltransferase [Polyangiaceae bacterium]
MTDARIVLDPGEELLQQATALVEGEYWNEGVSRERLLRAFRGSTAVAVALDGDGSVVATARALSDGARAAWIGDVCVARGWRGRGLGKAVTRALLEHPRDADRVRLNTRDAQGLYLQLGFVATATEKRPYPSAEMVLRRR